MFRYIINNVWNGVFSERLGTEYSKIMLNVICEIILVRLTIIARKSLLMIECLKAEYCEYQQTQQEMITISWKWQALCGHSPFAVAQCKPVIMAIDIHVIN